MDCCNIGYSTETHFKLQSRNFSFVRNFHCGCPIILTFSIWYDCITTLWKVMAMIIYQDLRYVSVNSLLLHLPCYITANIEVTTVLRSGLDFVSVLKKIHWSLFIAVQSPITQRFTDNDSVPSCKLKFGDEGKWRYVMDFFCLNNVWFHFVECLFVIISYVYCCIVATICLNSLHTNSVWHTCPYLYTL